MSIYIVESEQTDRRWIESRLAKEASYACRFFTSLQELEEALFEVEGGRKVAGSQAQIGLVDVIIMPLEPIGLGLELATRIKSSPLYQDVPILVTAQVARPESVQIAFSFGASDYVEKPLREFEFLARLRACLRIKHEIDRRKARERELLESTKQLSDLNRILMQLSMMDGLTGVANRRCFDASLEREWKRSFRTGSPLGLVMMDIDFFKLYNDRFGHRAGDHCLVQVAKTVQNCLQRPGDVLTRYGGEEFAAILPDTGLEGAKLVAENIRKSVEEVAIPSAGAAPAVVNASASTATSSNVVTLSLGVASLVPSDNSNSQDLIERADRALYKAKELGRNRAELDVTSQSKKVTGHIPKSS